MKYLIFAASHRPGSYNRKLARHAASHIAAQGSQVDFAEYAEFDMPLYNDTQDVPDSAYVFANRAAAADALVISSPEYNWSYPGSLKNIIDWISKIKPNPVMGKTVMLMSASTGVRGGILGLDHLKTPLESVQMHVYHRMFPLSNCEQAFGGDDKLLDRYAGFVNPLLDGFVTFTRKLSNT